MQYFIFSDCTVIDVENGCAALPHTDVYIAAGRIEGVLPHGERAAEYRGYKVIDAAGMYAVPGLVNLHVHLFGSGKPSKALGGGAAQKRLLRFIRTPLGRRVLGAIVASSAKTELLSGVTTLRAVGDFCGSDIALRDKCARGKGGAAGLRMLVSGPAITAPGGHGDGTFAQTARTPAEFIRAVDEVSAMGADFIKLCITGGVMDAKKRGEPGEVKMTAEQISAACERAHARGKKVAAHVQSAAGAELAARCGVDTIEHGAPLSDEGERMLKERGGAVVVTYSPALPCALLPREATMLNEDASYNSEVVMRGMTAGARQARAAGIAVGMGTDASCPFCMQSGMWREVRYFAREVGVSPAEALCAATLGNARILGLGEETGSVSVGKSADILLLRRDPLADLSALRDIAYISAQGRLIRRPRPKRRAQIEALLDTLWEERK